jgi:hypothetical protein
MYRVNSDTNPKIKIVLDIIATLEDVMHRRSANADRMVTGQYKPNSFLEMRVAALKRGVEECQQLCELNPPAEESYLGTLGKIAADALVECKRAF